MGVVQTDKWLIDLWNKPITMCELLIDYFSDIPDVSAAEIYQYLTMHGMYQQPFKDVEKQIAILLNKNTWKIINEETQELRKLWDGPNIPVFIFPSDRSNTELKKRFNGKAGLSFHDKLFLFISGDHSTTEIKALLTHEYHHVCRLAKLNKKVEDYNLLDSIILEGLAEHAVAERFGAKYRAGWTAYYSDKELESMWQHLVLPSIHLPKAYREHDAILYGQDRYPEMAGYCVGYYLVRKYMERNSLSSKDLLSIPSLAIAKQKD